ncbi:WD40/YVTN/BNR-like repeat-containing protein [Flavobacterium caseinilyticum]|uniref:Oxidoreductase n=1 Tax=Flavobacterium caseinilyticum TaxID=2541732 RepID=A0A4R5AX49_9FLAO|nr:oxidoreductase [Flavobacterium caseinilyticum]TDD77403.1 oxidoreductase [Flavobacterium caseinilyticum]
MKNIFLILLVLNVCISCKINVYTEKKVNDSEFQSIQIDTLFQDKISIRAIQIDGNIVWYGADNGRYGFYNLKTKQKNENQIIKDSSKLEFRSIAQTAKHVFILNVANPAMLHRISKDGKETKVVYQENHEKVFYDSMQFWDDQEGIAMGDPITDCLNIITTRDGGNSWKKIPCLKLPKVAYGEAAFAASNTNIVIKGSNTWIVSGGKKSRVFYSSDRGNSWNVYETPIVQGKSMTGIFTADFYDANNGFIAGGDYEIRNQNFSNKAITTNGGKTWKLTAENQGFGYASCVQYVPKSNAKELVTVGFSGIYYSSDSGVSWKQLSTDSTLNTIRFIDENTAIAAGQNKMIRINFK